ncbi:hypothetical protein QCA50_011121 [Cerrena zonata]|uniref:BRCT domain-containing protein n=1 Tax=Cerrena zonata TaxID=2478898 RepID=A0AAW0G3Q7_9APHY
MHLIVSLESHGGTVSRTPEQKSIADFYFCAGKEDPWLSSLLEHPIVVFHAAWIDRSAEANFALSRNYFILDHYEPASPSPIVLPLAPPPRPDNKKDATPKRGITRKRSMNEILTPDSDRRPLKKLRVADTPLPEPRSQSSPIKESTVRFSSPPIPVPEHPFLQRQKPSKKPKHKSLELEIEFTKQDIKASKTQSSSSLRPWKDLLEKHQAISPVPRIPVSDALEALEHVSTGLSTRFEPERTYCGHYFRCFRLQT